MLRGEELKVSSSARSEEVEAGAWPLAKTSLQGEDRVLRQSRVEVKNPNQDAEAAQKALDLAIGLARLLDRKKGDHVEIFDLRGITVIADFFVFATGYGAGADPGAR